MGHKPTLVSFMRDKATVAIEQCFTSYDNPKGNAGTERMMIVESEVRGAGNMEINYVSPIGRAI
jgi:hypothetical protein